MLVVVPVKFDNCGVNVANKKVASASCSRTTTLTLNIIAV